MTAERSAAARVSLRWPLISAGAAFALVAILALVIVYRESNKPFGFEVEWMSQVVAHRSAFWTVPAMVFNFLGGGITATIIAPGLIIIGLLVWRRPWAAVYFAAAEVASVILVQVLKNLIGRPRPTDILVNADFGSFPSGHSANAALIAATLGIVFLRVWVWVAGAVYTVGMMLSRTYLGAHWISDTIGGMLVGAGVAIIVWAPLALVLRDEQARSHPPLWQRQRLH
jgi:membrane-associated phospholipid phosphatase